MLRPSFTVRLFAVTALALAIVALWWLREAWLMLFGAVLIAALFNRLSRMFQKRLGLRPGLALSVALLLVLAVLGATFFLFGREVVNQFGQLQALLPAAWERAQAWALSTGFFPDLTAQLKAAIPSPSQVLNVLQGVAGGIAGALSTIGLSIVGGIYLAADPEAHMRGFLVLWPRERRPYIEETLRALGRALGGWLTAQFAAMLIIGALVTIGLRIIGSPSWLALGLIAGITQFIPLLGPILAAVPALLVGVVEGPHMLLLTAIVFVVVQQLEGNFITPIVQKEVAALPPSLSIFTLVIFGLMFGVGGVILAVPLTVVLYTLVLKCWVRDRLGEDVSLPGEPRGTHRGRSSPEAAALERQQKR